jgi:hypothetical protein
MFYFDISIKNFNFRNINEEVLKVNNEERISEFLVLFIWAFFNLFNRAGLSKKIARFKNKFKSIGFSQINHNHL